MSLTHFVNGYFGAKEGGKDYKYCIYINEMHANKREISIPDQLASPPFIGTNRQQTGAYNQGDQPQPCAAEAATVTKI